MFNPNVPITQRIREGVHEWQTHEGVTDATLLAAALEANTQAQLAIVYELETQNLLAAWNDTAPQVTGLDYKAIHRELLDRFGDYKQAPQDTTEGDQ